MNENKRESGFEYDGVFYEWHATDKGKDLRLIDQFTGLPPHAFFQAIEDDFDRGRGPVLLALIATSMRHLHQDWSIERIVRLVDELSLSEVEFIDGDEDPEEGEPRPPAEGEASPAPSQKSSESPEPTSETSPESQAFSGSPGSDTTSTSPPTR
jgi:hypothetical protein